MGVKRGSDGEGFFLFSSFFCIFLALCFVSSKDFNDERNSGNVCCELRSVV